MDPQDCINVPCKQKIKSSPNHSRVQAEMRVEINTADCYSHKLRDLAEEQQHLTIKKTKLHKLSRVMIQLLSSKQREERPKEEAGWEGRKVG